MQKLFMAIATTENVEDRPSIRAIKAVDRFNAWAQTVNGKGTSKSGEKFSRTAILTAAEVRRAFSLLRQVLGG